MLQLLRPIRVWLGIAAIVLALLLYRSLHSASDAQPAPATSPKRFAAISNGKVDVEGGIISIAARVPGIVQTVLVQEGDRVTKGQVLARQDDTEAQLRVRSAQAAADEEAAAAASLRVKRASAERELARLRPLADRGFVPKQRLDQARDLLAVTHADLLAQEAAAAAARSRQQEAMNSLELTNIRAPSSGLIVRRYANPGSGASTLNVSTMFELQPDAPHIVRAQISAATVAAIRVGQPVEIVPESDSSKVYPGRVLRLGAVFGARTLQSDDPYERNDERVLEVVVSAPEGPLLIGQRVMVRFLPKT